MLLDINLQPKQAVFYNYVESSPASWLGYGGSRGGAKSGAIRRIMVLRRLKYPRTTGLILRRVWDDVLKNHVNKMWDEFPQLRPFYKAAEHVIELPNGSKIFFDSAENAIDVDRKAFGTEFMDIFVDQAEQFTEAELVQFKTVCRWPATPLNRCKFGLFFNPGGVGAAFLQRVFYTGEYHEKEKGSDYKFLQAYGWDNVEWSRAALTEDGFDGDCKGQNCKKCAICAYYSWDHPKRFRYFIARTQYGQEMDRLPAHLRAGQLMGDFKKFAGQYFSNFDPAVHVWGLDEITFQPYWPRWISIDWGFQHASAIYWHCQVGTTNDEGVEKRLVITYREHIVSGISERALAEEIVAHNEGDPIQNIYGGHDLWKKESSNKTKEEQMSAVFRLHGMPSIKRARIERVDGWRYMHTALDEGEWIITANCREAVKALLMAVFDEKKQNEDVLKTNDKSDDARDSLRYGLFSQYNPQAVPDTIKLKRRVAHIEDPTGRAIQLMKLGEQKKHNPLMSRSGARYARYHSRRSKRFR